MFHITIKTTLSSVRLHAKPPLASRSLFFYPPTYSCPREGRRVATVVEARFTTDRPSFRRSHAKVSSRRSSLTTPLTTLSSHPVPSNPVAVVLPEALVALNC